MKTAILEQSKRIKELGIEIDSYFVWDKLPDKNDWWVQPRWMVEDDSMAMISAPSVDEMLDIMPEEIQIENNYYALEVFKEDGLYLVGYDARDESIEQHENKSLSEACADMLIWLAKNKYLE